MPGMFKLFLLEGINWSLIIDHEQEDSTYSTVLLR